jgi:hypothetical protein
MIIKHQDQSLTATPNSNLLGRNLLGAVLIFILALLMVGNILIPDVLRLLVEAMFIQNIPAWVTTIGSFLLTVFMLAFPIFLILQGFKNYWDGRALDQIGILTEGSITEKWIEESDDNPIYFVRYKYFLDLNAFQVVNQDIFQQLTCDQVINVLLLENAPYISRPDFNA